MGSARPFPVGGAKVAGVIARQSASVAAVSTIASIASPGGDSSAFHFRNEQVTTMRIDDSPLTQYLHRPRVELVARDVLRVVGSVECDAVSCTELLLKVDAFHRKSAPSITVKMTGVT